eukprot:25413-Eustigmatos_ZCMA.PRE.1
MVPAEQRLAGNQHTGGEIDLRLKVQLKLILFEGLAQFLSELDALLALFLELGAVGHPGR